VRRDRVAARSHPPSPCVARRPRDLVVEDAALHLRTTRGLRRIDWARAAATAGEGSVVWSRLRVAPAAVRSGAG